MPMPVVEMPRIQYVRRSWVSAMVFLVQSPAEETMIEKEDDLAGSEV